MSASMSSSVAARVAPICVAIMRRVVDSRWYKPPHAVIDAAPKLIHNGGMPPAAASVGSHREPARRGKCAVNGIGGLSRPAYPYGVAAARVQPT